MSEHQYLDVFLKEEDRMAKEMLRGFVEKEIMQNYPALGRGRTTGTP